MRYTLRITVGIALLVACHSGRAEAADAARDVSAHFACSGIAIHRLTDAALSGREFNNFRLATATRDQTHMH